MPARQDTHPALLVVLDAVLYVPAGHERHALARSAELYVPATQRVQTLAPGFEKVPAPHWMQTEDEEAPVAVPNMPAGQSSHSSVPLPRHPP